MLQFKIKTNSTNLPLLYPRHVLYKINNVICQILSSFYHFTHEDLQELLSLCPRCPVTPPLRLGPCSFFCVSFLLTSCKETWPQKGVTAFIYNLNSFYFCLGFCLPRYKRGTDVIFTTLSFSSPSSLSSSSPTDTSMMSVGLLLSLWFCPCSWESDMTTPCDHNY